MRILLLLGVGEPLAVHLLEVADHGIRDVPGRELDDDEGGDGEEDEENQHVVEPAQEISGEHGASSSPLGGGLSALRASGPALSGRPGGCPGRLDHGTPTSGTTAGTAGPRRSRSTTRTGCPRGSCAAGWRPRRRSAPCRRCRCRTGLFTFRSQIFCFRPVHSLLYGAFVAASSVHACTSFHSAGGSTTYAPLPSVFSQFCQPKAFHQEKAAVSPTFARSVDPPPLSRSWRPTCR